MKTEQIVLALAIAREGSITKAAESLFISQPNASSLLIKLEKEIGYCIFQRQKDGMLLTDEGKVFLEQALHIEQALHTIIQAGQGIRQIDFAVFSFQLSFSELAFETLCEKYHAVRHAGQMRFQIIRNTDDTARMIKNGNGDVAILMCLKKLLDSYKRRMDHLSLEAVPICEFPMELICKKGHPIIQNGKIHTDLLGDYPGFSGVSRSTLEPYLSFFDAGLGISDEEVWRELEAEFAEEDARRVNLNVENDYMLEAV